MEVEHISGHAGGFLVGNSHKNSGIKAINKSTGQPLEMEGGEVVITKTAVNDGEKREFEGELLTNRQILSRINESGGGVSFADGGDIPTELNYYGTSFKFGGETMTDYEIAHKISKCGCEHDKFEDGGNIENKIDYTTNLLEKEIEENGYFTEVNHSKTSFGQSNYIYVSNKADEFGFLDGDKLKIRISDHDVSNMDRVFNEIHVQPLNKHYDSKNIFTNTINIIKFRFDRDKYFTEEKDIEKVKAHNVQTTDLWHNDVVTKDYLTKKGKQMYEVTRTYNNSVTKYVNKENGTVFKTIPDKFEEGGNIILKELNIHPQNFEELRDTLELAVSENTPKKTTDLIQVNFFHDVVRGDLKLNLSKYYGTIQILPPNKREYFQYYLNNEGLEEVFENPYNLLPEKLTNINEIKPLHISPTPDNENLGKISDLITGNDTLRPFMNGVFFNLEEERIEMTNAHVLLLIKEKPHVTESSICLMGRRKEQYLKNRYKDSPIPELNNEGCWKLDGNYPKINSIIPSNFKQIVSINAGKLFQYCEAANYFVNPVTQLITLVFKGDDNGIEYICLNSELLKDCLKAMLLLGHSELELAICEGSNKPVLIIPKGNSRKISPYNFETDFAMCMPIKEYAIGIYTPVYDLDVNEATIYGKVGQTIEIEEEIPTESISDEIIPLLPMTDEVIDERQEIEETIAGLEILLSSASRAEKKELKSAIDGLKLLLELESDEKFESSGAVKKLLAPNGKPSNLNPTQYQLVRSPEFKKWFGDWENDPANSSKVLDKNGEPLIVYHGTNTSFNTFKPSKSIGTHGETDQIEVIYFTSKEEVANWYALDEYNPKYLKSVFLSMKNPFFTKNFENLKKELNIKLYSEVNKKLKNYDGLIIEEGFYTLGLNVLYLAFEPNQIKLADGTNSTFNPENNDIRFDKGGPINQNNFVSVQTPLDLKMDKNPMILEN